MSEVAVVQERSLAKGLLAGFIGGIVATAAKTLAERVYPPRTHGEPEPPEVLAEKIAGRTLSALEKTAAMETIHWGFGAAVGAAYGGVAEFFPAVTDKDGASFGMTLATLTHETALPAMGLSAGPEEQTAREHTSEMATHLIFGVVTETVRRFIKGGTYADGVVAVLPTVTYPDHTTLITGVWPAEHGILNNQVFDPERTLDGAWYWYAESIKVPTLWDVAHAAGIGTASVSWPVSVNARSVDTLVPEFWHGTSVGAGTNPQDRYLMAAVSRPEGGLEEMERRIGPYMMGNDTSVENGDRVRTRFAVDILKNKKPGFMTIHLSAMDGSEHEAGPFSALADKTLEAVDGMVGELIEAAMANDPATKVVVVSDHGFLNITHTVNLYEPFVQAGMVEFGKKMGHDGETTVVTSWKAQLWTAGGLTAVMLHDPKNEAVKAQVKGILDKLVADPANGIERVLDEQETRERGGFTGASYVIVMKPGYTMGSAMTGPMVVESSGKGSHGFLPQFPEMHSSFFVMGTGVAKGRDLGTIDMRQIAPTVAGILGVSLPAAKQEKLKIE